MDTRTFELTARSNLPRGYKDELCFVCTNGKDTSQKKITVSQSD